jgi:outer membrane protein TolC
VAVPQPPVAAPDPLTQRRLTRDRLEKNLEAARARLDLAQKALAETVSPQEGELQVTQGQPLPEGSAVPQAASGRSNCTSIATPNGARVVCPHLVPAEQYYERIDRMQEQVRLAQQAVEDAELAYRRGVD